MKNITYQATYPSSMSWEGRVSNMHCNILLNSRAGALHATVGVDQMRQMIQEIGLDAEVIGTESVEEMDATLKRLVAAGVQKVAIAGGDGTVARAVQPLAHSNTVLGIIPQGTANNFATALRLPQDLPSALRVVKEGEIREVDLGKTFDRYFTEAAGVGLFADILALYGAGTNKNFFRGLYAMARVFCSLTAHRLRLTIDGKPYTKHAVMCTVANAFRMAEGVPVAPDATLTDGELDVVIIGDLKRSELIPYYLAFRAQMQHGLPKVTMLCAKEIKIEANHSINVHCDDQIVGSTPVTISAQPRALKVLVDKI